MNRPQRPQIPQNQQGNMGQNYYGNQGGQFVPQNVEQQQIAMQKQNQMQNPNQMQGYNTMTDNDMMQMLLEKKKKRNKIILKVFIGILITVLLSVLLYFIGTGRVSSKVVELEAKVAQLEQDKVDMTEERNARVAELQQAIKDMTVTELLPTTSLQRVEATGVPELWLQEGDFIAPNPLQIPETVDSVNDSYVQIGEKFTFRPSDRWLLNSQGSTYEFSHPQKIWGKIRALTSKNEVLEADMQPLIQSFFLGYPETTITYRKIFIDAKVVGLMGKATVDMHYTPEESTEATTKEMVINVGFVQRSGYVISFLFVYDAEGGSNSQELLDLLLKSGSYGVPSQGQVLKLE